jgi:hypothetical protein
MFADCLTNCRLFLLTKKVALLMKKIISIILVPIALTFLSSCKSYAPHLASDAESARLRISERNFTGMVMPFLEEITSDGKCGERVQVPFLSVTLPITVSRNTTPNPAGNVPKKQPRENMLGTSEPERTEETELRLKPGRYGLLINATVGGYPVVKTCPLKMEMTLNAGEQYWIELASINSICRTTFSRVRDTASGPSWLPEAPVNFKSYSCTK